MNSREQQIRKELAEVLKKHKVAIVSSVVGNYSEIHLQYSDRREGKSHILTKIHIGRCHTTAYDLTGEQ